MNGKSSPAKQVVRLLRAEVVNYTGVCTDTSKTEKSSMAFRKNRGHSFFRRGKHRADLAVASLDRSKRVLYTAVPGGPCKIARDENGYACPLLAPPKGSFLDVTLP